MGDGEVRLQADQAQAGAGAEDWLSIATVS